LLPICCMDSKALFGIERDERSLKQADIKAACDNMGVEASEELRVVPVCPNEPVGAENMALVSGRDRAVLAKIWRHAGDEGMYAQALDRIAGA